MDDQLFVGDRKPSTDYMTELGNWDIVPEVPNDSNLYQKPYGGIWTSTFSDGESEWSETEHADGKYWRLTVSDDTEVFIIDSMDDLRSLPNRDEQKIAPDFEQVAESYDAVRATADGIDAAGLDAWEVESTVWFDWCFESVGLIQ